MAVCVVFAGLNLLGVGCVGCPDQCFKTMSCFEGLLAAWTGRTAHIGRGRAAAQEDKAPSIVPLNIPQRSMMVSAIDSILCGHIVNRVKQFSTL